MRAASTRVGAVLAGSALAGLGGALIAAGCSGAAAKKTPPAHHPKKPTPKVVPHQATTTPTGSFTFVAGGDVALAGAGATSSTFAGIAQYLHGDIVFGNQEGVLAVGGTPKCSPYGVDGCFTFEAAPSSAAELGRAGFTLMNIANNHALDYGPGAQTQTIDALTGAHIAYDGLPGQITVVQAGDVKVAVIGCAPYPWAQSLIDIAATEALVREATKRADVVLVYMHAGAEGSSADHVPDGDETFYGEDRGNVRAFAHGMIDAGASLVFASGPHTLRGLEWYHDHLIAYSLGNLAGDNTLSVSGSLAISALLNLDLSSTGAFISGKLIPLVLVGAGTPEPDPSGQAITFMRTLSDEDFAAPRLTISSDGTITPPS